MKKNTVLIAAALASALLLTMAAGCKVEATVKTEPNVTGIRIFLDNKDVTSATIESRRGRTLEFTAEVEPAGGSVTWTVSSSKSSIMPASGKLSIAATETAGAILTVTATSNKNPSVSARTKVKIAGTAPPQGGTFTISTAGGITSVSQGGSLQFSVDANGSAPSVTWSISSGGRAGGTAIDPVSGMLTVDADEPAGDVIIRAASTANQDVYDEITITVTIAPPGTIFAIAYNRPFPGGNIDGPASAAADSTVTLTLLPNGGNTLQSFTVTQTGGGENVPVNENGGTRTFTMPSFDVTVSAFFAADGGGALPDPDNGTDGLQIGDIIEGKGKLVWRDEFTGDSLDLDKWNYDYGGGGQYDGLWGWGNGERQWYKPENVRVENGHLVIEVKKDYPDVNNPYSSGKISTKGTLGSTNQTSVTNNQQFPPKDFLGVPRGYAEARLRGPKGNGFWPAFWMLGANCDVWSGYAQKVWPGCCEIDIMETTGGLEDHAGQTIHCGPSGWPEWWYYYSDYYFPAGEGAGDTFHTYAVKWNDSGLTFYVDGNINVARWGNASYEMASDTINIGFPPKDGSKWHEPFTNDIPKVIIFNLAVGGNMGNGEPSDAALTTGPWENRSLTVDWVRVYEEVN